MITLARMLVARRYCILSWLEWILVPKAGESLSREDYESIESKLVPNFVHIILLDRGWERGEENEVVATQVQQRL